MTHKLVYLARRAATVAREDWPRTWRSHAIFASQFPVLEASIDWMRYCNRVDDVDIPGLSAAHDGVSVAAAETPEALTGAGFSGEERDRIDADELRVFDMLTPHFTFHCREETLRDGIKGEAALFTFLVRKPGLDHAEFDARWNGPHRAAADSALAGAAAVTRYVHNRPVHDPLPLFPFDGIAEAWFATVDDAVHALRGGQLDPLRDDLATFCDMERSEAVLTKVCHRWPKD